MALYELAVLGSPTAEQLQGLGTRLREEAKLFQLKLGDDITLAIQPSKFEPQSLSVSAAIFFGGIGSADIDIGAILDLKVVPVLPVASTNTRLAAEIPPVLQTLNCLFYNQVGEDRVFTALLECIGLLPQQRKVFLSYRRKEVTAAALQLFAELSARQFIVFLDTHCVGPAVEFQETLWHELCNVDVFVMLESPGYFDSRWTTVEYGRAQAKGMGILDVRWPNVTPCVQAGAALPFELAPDEIDETGQLSKSTVERLCIQLEKLRSSSYAARHVSMISNVRAAVERVEGRIDSIGPHRSVHLTLRTGRHLVVQPTIGVPTAVTLQETIERADPLGAAIVYDHLGIKRSWLAHLEWLAINVKGARWVKATDAAWEFAGWET